MEPRHLPQYYFRCYCYFHAAGRCTDLYCKQYNCYRLSAYQSSYRNRNAKAGYGYSNHVTAKLYYAFREPDRNIAGRNRLAIQCKWRTIPSFAIFSKPAWWSQLFCNGSKCIELRFAACKHPGTRTMYSTDAGRFGNNSRLQPDYRHHNSNSPTGSQLRIQSLPAG